MAVTQKAARSTKARGTAGSAAGSTAGSGTRAEGTGTGDRHRAAGDAPPAGREDGQDGRRALRQALARPGSAWPSTVPDAAEERLSRLAQDVIPAVGRTAGTAHEIATLRNSGTFVANYVADLTPLLGLLAAELTGQWNAGGLLASHGQRDRLAADLEVVLCAAGLLAGIAVLTGQHPQPADQPGTGNAGPDPGVDGLDADDPDLDLALRGRLALARIAATAGVDHRFPGTCQATVVPPLPDAPPGSF